jgi:hypothetical protein
VFVRKVKTNPTLLERTISASTEAAYATDLFNTAVTVLEEAADAQQEIAAEAQAEIDLLEELIESALAEESKALTIAGRIKALVA